MEDGKRRLELDFVCLAEGRLLAGEAKSNGTLGNAGDAAKEVKKTVRGARLLEADRVVFATTESTWDAAALAAVAAGTSRLDPPLAQLMTGLR